MGNKIPNVLTLKEKHDYFLKHYTPHHTKLLRYCESILKNKQDAEDIVSEAALVAYERMHTLRREESFGYFLFGIAKHMISKKLRRKKFWGLFIPDKANKIPYDGKLEKNVDIQLLYKALDQLPEAQKEALILFEIAGYSIKEIAEIQESGVSAIKARLARGRKKLALFFESKTPVNIWKTT